MKMTDIQTDKQINSHGKKVKADKENRMTAR